MYKDAELEIKKDGYSYKAEEFWHDAHPTLVCTTTNLLTKKKEVVKFEGEYGNCIKKQVRKAGKLISKTMLNVAYSLVVSGYSGTQGIYSHLVKKEGF